MSSHPGLAERIYRLVLRAYPTEYIETFGDEMQDTFLVGLKEAGDRGDIVLFVLRELRDIPKVLASAYWHGWKRKLQNSIQILHELTSSSDLPPALPDGRESWQQVLWELSLFLIAGLLLIAATYLHFDGLPASWQRSIEFMGSIILPLTAPFLLIGLARAEEFVTVTKHAASITLKTGVKKDGTFTARQVTIYWNGGAYADASPMLVPAGTVRAVGPYRIPAVHVDSFGIYTNLPPAGAYRGAMSSQTTWAYESQMDIIARKMGWDPLEFRMKNMFVSGDHFATGEELHDVHFVECLDASVKSLRAERSISEVEAGRAIGRGYGVMMKSTVATSKSQAKLKLMDDGTVTLFTSTVEMGQGGHTTMAQITAENLGVPMSLIKIVGPDTSVTPFDSTTSASRSTSMMGNAVIAACGLMKQKLFELAAPLLETPPDQLRTEKGFVVANETSISFADILKRNNLHELDEAGEYSTSLGIDPETGQGVATPHWHQGAGAAEVEVDTETGRVTVLRYAAASFAGRVVNPRMAQLQNDGNVIVGLGPALMEQIVYDGGQATNPNLADYAIPSIRDIPAELISVCIESNEGEMHGIGEMTLPPVAPAIANAIEDAVGVRIKDLPITAEKVLRALKEKLER